MKRLTLLVALAVFFAVSTSALAQAPTDITGGAVNITTVQAALQGTVNPNGGTAVDYHFAYGPATTPVTYPHGTTWTSVGAGSSTVGVQQTLTGLTPGTVYHYRLETRYTVKGNSSNTSQGADATFTTAATAPPPSNTVAPTISGVPMPAASGISGAGTLTATAGTWTGSPSYAYQWQDCDATGANCRNATGAGATTSSYTVGVNDTTGTIKVQVTATNSSGNGTASAITGPAPALWSAGGPPTGGSSTGGPAQEAALFHVIQVGSKSQVDTIHSVNPNDILYQHDVGYSSLTNPVAADVGNPCRDANVALAQANAHTPGDPTYDWFNYSPVGFAPANRISAFDSTANGGTTIYSMDTGNSAWQQDCATQDIAKAAAIDLGKGLHDGVYIDNMDLSVSHLMDGGAINPFPGFPFYSAAHTYTSDADWNASLDSYMAALKARFAAVGMIGPIANVGYGYYYSGTAPYNAIVNAAWGSEEQGFIPVTLNAQQDSYWLDKVNEGVYNEAHGRYWNASQNATAVGKEWRQTYGIASFLMAANGLSTYDLTPTDETIDPSAFIPAELAAMELGPATGGYSSFSAGGVTVYERNFANGVVVANPSQSTTASFSPTPGGTYSGRDCSAVNNACTTLTNASSLSLGPDGGAVLLH